MVLVAIISPVLRLLLTSFLISSADKLLLFISSYWNPMQRVSGGGPGVIVGFAVGVLVGITVGEAVGGAVIIVGEPVVTGAVEGASVSVLVGLPVGDAVGGEVIFDGEPVVTDALVGESVGVPVGVAVGGTGVGATAMVGDRVRLVVGLPGDDEGERVGNKSSTSRIPCMTWQQKTSFML
jgi:hypothetical protein